MTLSGGIPTATRSFIQKSGPGTLLLSGTNNYSGGTNVAGGTVQFAGLSSLGSGAVNLDSGTLKWATGNTADVSSLFLILTSAGGTLDTNGNNVTLANPIGGNGAGVLTKAGAGKLDRRGQCHVHRRHEHYRRHRANWQQWHFGLAERRQHHDRRRHHVGYQPDR